MIKIGKYFLSKNKFFNVVKLNFIGLSSQLPASQTNLIKFNFCTAKNLINQENNEAIITRLQIQYQKVKTTNFKEAEVISLLQQVSDWKSDIENNLIVIDKTHGNIFEIAYHILYARQNFINEKNVDPILPLLVKSCYYLKIADKTLWDKIDEIYFSNIENIRKFFN